MGAGPERIDSGQLIELLGMIRGSRLVTITAETVPVMRQRSAAGAWCPWFDQSSKPGQPSGRRFSIRKRSAFSAVAVGKRRPGGPTAYELAVNRKRARDWSHLGADGTPEYFDTGSRAWGKRRRGCPLVDYRGRLYLDVQKLRLLSSRFVDSSTGQTVQAAELAPWMSTRPESGVRWRDYRLSGVRSVSVDGRAFELVRGQRIGAAAESWSDRTKRRRALRRPAKIKGG